MTDPEFDGRCPWCGEVAAGGVPGVVVSFNLGCSCGAIALGARAIDVDEVIDDLANYYRLKTRYDPTDLGALGIDRRDGGTAPGPRGDPIVWHWFRAKGLDAERALPGADDARRFQLYLSIAEDAYDRMYDARDPFSFYLKAKDYFESAHALAQKLGMTGEARAVAERLAHVKAVYRSQFSR